jgi:REP element-mobilizing transposase RayT
MPRAKRYYIPGCVWHITHRCHKREFLLKFSRDRNRWLELLYTAKKRYGLVILDFIITSNHIHLLVLDDGNRDTIPKSMQMVAGQTGQEYNRRKNRKGAYWEDRYHATAVESGAHLMQCLVYIDMNMVRTGVVSHPSDWRWSGYNEIQNQKQRYAIINYERLSELLGLGSAAMLKGAHAKLVEEALKANRHERDLKWSQAVAVGSKSYVDNIKEKLGIKVIYRGTRPVANGFELREDEIPYDGNFTPKSARLSHENGYFWSVFE